MMWVRRGFVFTDSPQGASCVPVVVLLQSLNVQDCFGVDISAIVIHSYPIRNEFSILEDFNAIEIISNIESVSFCQSLLL